MKIRAAWCAWVMLAATPVAAQVPGTDRLMLSGQGPDDAVPWEFTIDGGARAGERTTIPVPSNWQQQGFGHYQYGYDHGARSNDHAVYRRHVVVPVGWRDRTIRIVFDGVMTDALVSVNGEPAGPVHQGGFNRFSFDVTQLLKPGADNVVEVAVSEGSAAKQTDVAERWGDYWVFGGIYRPVWLEAAPTQAIGHVAINATADGDVSADVDLTAPQTVTRLTGQVMSRDGRPVGQPFAVAIPAGGAGRVRLAGHLDRAALWSAETPNLYDLDVTLWQGDVPVHHVITRFGFRTFEVRQGQGLFLNGQRIVLKGANRHSFRPATGRALTRADAYADVRMLRDLNMNAVRMSHYAPDQPFLEAADELGLYVLDELSGWQHAHDTAVGRILVRELVERDVNHPSILFWDNGNEGGWNRELDGDFALYDPQSRPVLHPWELHAGIDTKHYPRYPDLEHRLAGPNLVMPTEFLHGLFDGGGGAGLDDYWRAILASPRGAGGFLWNFADEGIARTDQGGRIDTAGTLAPDGIVGPNHEKEPSYFTVKDVWSPVQVAAPVLDARFDGALALTNRYDFTNLSALNFAWRWLRFPDPAAGTTAPKVLAAGQLAGPAVAPHGAGRLILPIPAARGTADALALDAFRDGAKVDSWIWPTPARVPATTVRANGTVRIERSVGEVRLVAGVVTARFDAASGQLTGIARAGQQVAITSGPRLVFARPETGQPSWTVVSDAGGGVYRAAHPEMADRAEVILDFPGDNALGGFTLQVSPDGTAWHTVYQGRRIARDGNLYPFPSQRVAAVRVQALTGSRGTPTVQSVRLGWRADRYPSAVPANVMVTTGIKRDPAEGGDVAWLEAPGSGGLERVRWTLSAGGTLALAYRYRLDGPMLFHGIGLDVPADAPVTAMMRGPWPVYQNRLRGPLLGVHALTAPGYYADPRWLRLDTATARLVIRSENAPFLQVGQRMADLPTTSVDFPATNLGFLQAIPAMGAKSQPAETTGPQGRPATAMGVYEGRLRFALIATNRRRTYVGL